MCFICFDFPIIWVYYIYMQQLKITAVLENIFMKKLMKLSGFHVDTIGNFYCKLYWHF